jgi:hypothetical protein
VDLVGGQVGGGREAEARGVIFGAVGQAPGAALPWPWARPRRAWREVLVAARNGPVSAARASAISRAFSSGRVERVHLLGEVGEQRLSAPAPNGAPVITFFASARTGAKLNFGGTMPLAACWRGRWPRSRPSPARSRAAGNIGLGVGDAVDAVLVDQEDGRLPAGLPLVDIGKPCQRQRAFSRAGSTSYSNSGS